jgi:SAM-dependent methyltransferase
MKTTSVIPWVELAFTLAPDGTRLSLWKRDAELAIRAGSHVLMSNRAHGSEELLAEHGCRDLPGRARVLVGGLGMGFTLRAALAVLAPEARVVVTEACAPVIEWARAHFGAEDLLADRRVDVQARSVEGAIASARDAFDGILLDVDNGPVALAHATNARLYDANGVAAIARALRPGGRVAVWSRSDEPAFAARLGRAGLDATTVRARGHAGRGERHVLFVGVKPARERAHDEDRDPRTPAAAYDRSPDPRSRTRGHR